MKLFLYKDIFIILENVQKYDKQYIYEVYNKSTLTLTGSKIASTKSTEKNYSGSS